MSNIKIGDKIRFLNTTGGGIVRRFQGKDQVLVEDEDGFEVPALIRECVVVGSEEKQTQSSQRSPIPQVAAPKASVPTPQPTQPEPETVTETPEGERLNIFLAYLPMEPSKIVSDSRYEAYFINDSNYFLFFNYMSRQNNSWISRYNGLVEPNTQLFLEEFGKEDLNNLERVCVQLIAFKQGKPYSLKNAISVELHLDTVKFYKQHCFLSNEYFEDDALLYPIVRQDLPEKEPVEIPYFGLMPVTKHHLIYLRCDSNASYQAYMAVQNELAAAYNELRDDLARLKWQKNYAGLTPGQKQAVRQVYPQRISETGLEK